MKWVGTAQCLEKALRVIDTMGETMKLISTALAALTLIAIMAAGPGQTARADGGAVVIGVGVYLVGDYVAGRTCHMRDWPFNVVKKVYYGLQGKRVCRYHRYRH